MCLAVPGKVISIEGDNELRFGKVSFAGIERQVGLAFVPDAMPGDYVIVHVGYAIALLDPIAALRTLNLLTEIEEYREEGQL